MPRTADHAQRREQILQAMTAVALRDGLPAVSMRAVAAEAGISLRLVQYYFGSKAALMHAGLEQLESRSLQRWSSRTVGGGQASAFDTLLALFAEALPVDDEQRAFHFLWMSYAVLAMTDGDIPGRTFIQGPDRLQARIAAELERGIANREFRAAIDPAIESAALLALLHGLGTAVLVGQQDSATAMAAATLQLDRLRCADGMNRPPGPGAD
ncbi:TetR/AcrR family transcriptional regulator [Marilutibacter chinensis]|uniref:TetR family transcriptional regulator C-terminal domain-containing protein n=1 Tax=Marilutibacter chinensis TaxID=2912247 RepID=A0ABS9HQE9_9GAMM|nr:TetR family transcriptional regulator C-terminal domain-containing protein [Lysobacter chinensis]MCF7220542.1 TetR family transcriptional regulator C-terminal domain-containing protein [Lysobacter chinensis]